MDQVTPATARARRVRPPTTTTRRGAPDSTPLPLCMPAFSISGRGRAWRRPRRRGRRRHGGRLARRPRYVRMRLIHTRRRLLLARRPRRRPCGAGDRRFRGRRFAIALFMSCFLSRPNVRRVVHAAVHADTNPCIHSLPPLSR
jgi:hypothetical protein